MAFLLDSLLCVPTFDHAWNVRLESAPSQCRRNECLFTEIVKAMPPSEARPTAG